MSRHKVVISTRAKHVFKDNPWMIDYPPLKKLTKPKAYVLLLISHHETPLFYLAGSDKLLRHEACKQAGYMANEKELTRDGYNIIEGTDEDFEQAVTVFRKLFPHSAAIMLLESMKNNVFDILKEQPGKDGKTDYLQKVITVVRSDIIPKMVEQTQKLELEAKRVHKAMGHDEDESKPEEDYSDPDNEDDGEVL